MRNKIVLFFIFLELPRELVYLFWSFCGLYETSWGKAFPTLNFVVNRKAWEEDFGLCTHWYQQDSVSSFHQ